MNHAALWSGVWLCDAPTSQRSLGSDARVEVVSDLSSCSFKLDWDTGSFPILDRRSGGEARDTLPGREGIMCLTTIHSVITTGARIF